MKRHNPGIEAYHEQAMKQPIPEVLSDAAKALGLPADATFEEFLENVRAHGNHVPRQAVFDFYGAIPGWEMWDSGELDAEDMLTHGELAGYIDVDGAMVPAYVHMAVTRLTDRTDPALERLLASLADAPAIVLHVIPRFYLETDREGQITRILIAGGWYFDGTIWHPFVLSPEGTGGIPEKSKYINPGEPSRGLLRTAGFDAAMLNGIVSLFEAITPREGSPGHMHGSDDSEPKLGTQDDGWSQLISEAGFMAQQELMSSLAVPQAAKRTIDEEVDLDALAPDPVSDFFKEFDMLDQEDQDRFAEMAVLTNGFEGLDEQTCRNLTTEKVDALRRCSTASVAVEEIAQILDGCFGWDVAGINGSAEPETGTVGHGDVILSINSKSMGQNIPVVFHGGRIDPLEPEAGFAFAATRMMVQSRFDGAPVLVLPASISMRQPAGDPSVQSEPPLDKIVILAGYAFDGGEWYPVTFGKKGSDPFRNRLMPGSMLPQGESGYSSRASHGMSPIAAAFSLQVAIDRHHDLGPFVDFPREMNPVEDYKIQLWDDNWFTPMDVQQEEIYPPRVEE